jgi:hypothetical protein
MLILKIILKNKKNILKTITTTVKKNNFSYWIIAVKCLQHLSWIRIGEETDHEIFNARVHIAPRLLVFYIFKIKK